jgi:hypothetical protein
MHPPQHSPTKLLRRSVWVCLSLSGPDDAPGHIIHLKGQTDFLCRHHLPPDCHLLWIERAQAATKTLCQLTDSGRQLCF